MNLMWLPDRGQFNITTEQLINSGYNIRHQYYGMTTYNKLESKGYYGSLESCMESLLNSVQCDANYRSNIKSIDDYEEARNRR